MPQDLKGPLLVQLLERNNLREASVFTQAKRRANRLADLLVRHRLNTARIHGIRSQAQSPTARQAVAPTVCLGPPRIDRDGLMTSSDRTIAASASSS